MSAYIEDKHRQNVSLLRDRASKTAMQGVLIAVVAVVVATLGVAYTSDHGISLDGIRHAQSSNFMLWVLDVLPFVFGPIGQYASKQLADVAGEMIRAETDDLRQRADQMERQASFAATHDTVTELANRALFIDRLDQAIAQAKRREGAVAVMLLSIDNYKEVQDALGVASADVLLKQLAIRLSSWSSRTESIARVDSHVFAILLTEEVDKAQAKAKAESAAYHLQKALQPPFRLDSLQLTLQSSIGVVLYPEHGEDWDTLLQRGGLALYMAAKSHNGFALYSPALDEHSPRRLTLMSELQRAIERDELDLHYQPKVDIAGGRIVGAEALVRWRHPTHDFISPDEFIGLAERTRLIKPLTQWVMERAFRDCAAMHAQGHDLKISVNLSTMDLHDPEFPDVVAGVMAKTGIQPEWIVFEITEGSIMLDPARVQNVLERIHAMGFALSIDDFGTGYSSLAYLKRLPVMELKIDKSFVMDMMTSENDAIIVRATTELAHNLGLKLTAEGVETREIMQRLAEFGCDIAQGYWISRPISLKSFNVWLETSEWAKGEARPPHAPHPASMPVTGDAPRA